MHHSHLNTPHIVVTGAILVRIGLSPSKSRFSETQIFIKKEYIPIILKIKPIQKLFLSLFKNPYKSGAYYAL